MTKEWWLKLAESEGDSEVGCGVTPKSLDDGRDIVRDDGSVDYYSDRVARGLNGEGLTAHSSNGCCWEDCKVCKGAPCYSSLCKKCSPGERIYSVKGSHIVLGIPSPLAPDFKTTIDTPTQQDRTEAMFAAKIRQTGFDKWLEKKLENSEFKREYEKALKEIQEYDRRENERRQGLEYSKRDGLEKESPEKPS